VKFHFNEPPIQGARGIHAGSCPKGEGSKARVVTYRTRDPRAGVGLASKDSWLTRVNSWLKPRERKAAKPGMERPARAGLRSRTKMATVPGGSAGKSRAPLGRTVPGVKREPTSPVPRSRQGTPETLVLVCIANETRGEIGSKRMPRVMPGIGLMANPKGCPLPVTLIEDNRW